MKIFSKVILILLVIVMCVAFAKSSPVLANTISDNLSAKNYIVIDENGYVLLEKKSDEKKDKDDKYKKDNGGCIVRI